MKTTIKDIGIVWLHDWQDLYRSRLAAFWLSLYLLGAVSSCLFFTMILNQIENKVALEVKLAPTQKAGTMTTGLQQSRHFQEILKSLIGDEDLARQFVTTPVIVLFFGWMSLTFAPFLVILLTSESISSDISTGAARFTLIRTARVSYVIGKCFSQASLIMLCIFLSAVAAFVVAAFRLSSFDPLSVATYLLAYSLRACIYVLPFLGLGLAVSQMIKSVQLSRAIGMVVFFVTVILFYIADHYSGDGFARLWELVVIILPQGHRLDFWRPDLMSQLSAVSFSIGLAFIYLFTGFSFFARKDV